MESERGMNVKNVSLQEILQRATEMRASDIHLTCGANVCFRVHGQIRQLDAALSDDANLVAIPLRKGDDSASLREAINHIIGEMKASGELAALSEKYFGTDMTQE